MTGQIRNSVYAVLFCASCAALFGGQTRTWTQGDFNDFEKGVIKNLSVRSDGVVTLAPRSKEWSDTSAMYLWSLARDSKGNLYAGGGTGAKLYRIGTDGKNRVLAELDGLEIHAVAVDSKDRVYAATAPDGKVYRVSANGKADVFYDPHAKYIWALAFDRNDDLFVATGDQGELHRVAPDGKGKVFFRCDETHVRSLALDSQGNLIVGTEPGGLVLRISAAGEGFVLYQMPKREVTAVLVGRDGMIYASGVGTRSPSGPAVPAAPAPAPAAAAVNPAQPAPRQPAPALPLTTAPVNITGGSDVYSIDPSGSPRRVWTNTRDVVYALALDSSGHLLLGSGNRGHIYRVESPTLYTAVMTLPSTQVTAFQPGADGRLYAATGNVGKIYEISPEPETEGTLESDVFDAGVFTRWGRLSFDVVSNGGKVSVQTRSGNLDQPQKNWSPWSNAISDPKGDRITSPPSRFLQWKATLAVAGVRSPELSSVEVAYLPKNLEPHVDRIETTPFNYRFPAQLSVTPVQTMSLPPLVTESARTENTEPAAPPSTVSTVTPAMQSAKGFIGARWMAADPNGDSMVYSIEIRGKAEKEWKLLKDKVPEKYFSWDSTAFPDGEYRIRVTASDTPSNPPAEALTGHLESDPFVIDNTPPQITGLTATRNAGKLDVRWHAADALNTIEKAEYSLDGGDWTLAAPTTGLSDSLALDYNLAVAAGPGEHTVAVRVADAYSNQSADKTVIQ
jgi:sugar lactone lactonase YvrE